MPVRIVVIGSANVDYIMGAPRLPQKGETVTGCRFLQTFGGKGANQAVAAARAGGEVTLVGSLGNDATAHVYVKHLEDAGIDTSHLTLEAEVPSGSALVMFDGQGENYLTVAPGANECVTPARVHAAESAIASCDWVVLQQEIPAASNQAALELAAVHQRPVLLNHAPAHPAALLPDSQVHGLVVNELEAATLAGASLPEGDLHAAPSIAQTLRSKNNHRFVIITLGAHGAVLADHAGERLIPALPITPVDATAAGDTFCGALVVALGEGASFAEAARFASAAAALSVSRMGAQPSIPKRQEIDTLLSS